MWKNKIFAICAVAALVFAVVDARAQTTQITVWSHWPDEVNKRKFVESRVAAFNSSQSQCKANLTFIQAAEAYASLKTSVRTGQAPDIFWLTPDQTQFVDGGHLEPLDSYLDLNTLEPWAKEAWTHAGKVYGLPLEAYTVEIYYNKALLQQLGVSVGSNLQLSQDEFTEMVKKGAAAGITPIGSGVGDRNYPGAYVVEEGLLQKLGIEEYGKLVNGKLSFKDPRVLEVLSWVRDIAKLGAYPKSFMTLKLGESHYYFHTNPRSLTLPMGSWYTGRAFVPEANGGQPKDFPLGIMRFPAVKDASCPNCKTLAVAGSYVMYSKSKNKKCAGELLKSIATVENGNEWLTSVLLQTGLKTDPGKLTSTNAEYVRLLNAVNTGSKYFFGLPLQYMKGKCTDTYDQVLNRALPGGLISPEEAADKMDAACAQK